MATKNFDNSINRMKELMGYGRHLTEHATHNGKILMTKMGADGHVYGVIQENAYLYLKKATPKTDGTELLAEDFKFLTGVENKNDYKYNSVNKAQKNLDLKILAINESVLNENRVKLNKPTLVEERYRQETKSMREELNRFNNVGLNENCSPDCTEKSCEGKKELKYGKHPRFQKPVIDIPKSKGVEVKPYGEKVGDGTPFEVEVPEEYVKHLLTTIFESQLKKKLSL